MWGLGSRNLRRIPLGTQMRNFEHRQRKANVIIEDTPERALALELEALRLGSDVATFMPSAV